jgi:hypothetical protein
MTSPAETSEFIAERTQNWDVMTAIVAAIRFTVNGAQRLPG